MIVYKCVRISVSLCVSMCVCESVPMSLFVCVCVSASKRPKIYDPLPAQGRINKLNKRQPETARNNNNVAHRYTHCHTRTHIDSSSMA